MRMAKHLSGGQRKMRLQGIVDVSFFFFSRELDESLIERARRALRKRLHFFTFLIIFICFGTLDIV